MLHELTTPYHGKSGIYAIINILSGKMYIGSAKSIGGRINGHNKQLVNGVHYNDHLQRAFLKYGAESFAGVAIELCPKNKLVEKENEWIRSTQCNNPDFGYNKRLQANSNIGLKLGPNPRMAAWAKIHWNRPEIRALQAAKRVELKSHLRFAEYAKKYGHPQAAEYDYMSPCGERHQGRDVASFSIKHGLNVDMMRRIRIGKAHCHKGWTKTKCI